MSFSVFIASMRVRCCFWILGNMFTNRVRHVCYRLTSKSCLSAIDDLRGRTGIGQQIYETGKIWVGSITSSLSLPKIHTVLPYTKRSSEQTRSVKSEGRTQAPSPTSPRSAKARASFRRQATAAEFPLRQITELDSSPSSEKIRTRHARTQPTQHKGRLPCWVVLLDTTAR